MQLKKIVKALIYSNIWVGLEGGALTFITMWHLSFLPVVFIAFVASASVFFYNYMRLVQSRPLDMRNAFNFKVWIVSHWSELLGLSLFFGALSLILFWQIFQMKLFWLLLLPGFVSLVYPLSFKKALSGFTSLRTLPGLKILLIAATWSYVTVLVPMLLYATVSWEELIEFVMRILLIIALVIPFDIRDLKYDDTHLHTIPQKIGVKKARQLSMFLVMLYQFWVIARHFIFEWDIVFTVGMVLGLEVGYWLIRFAHKDRKDEYFSFWIEGIPIFCAVFLIIGQWLFL